MDIRLTRFVRFENEGALQAFCDVAVGDLVLVKGIRVVEGREGPFVTMPRQQGKNGKWYDSVVVRDKAMKDEMIRLVLEAYYSSQYACNQQPAKNS